MSFDNHIVIIKLYMYIVAIACQETDCIQGHLKLRTGADERAANGLHVTFPVKLDRNQLVKTLLFTTCVSLLQCELYFK